MTIPSVVQGLIETEDGKVFELDSPKGSAWVESIGSFRFQPSSDSKPYTVRKEAGIYWYGCRKVAGKVHKKYIGKSSEVTLAKLEAIAEALKIPSLPRAHKVAEVTQGVAEVTQEVAEVTQKVAEVTQGVGEVTQKVAEDRLTALELQVANLQKTVEALQEALLGKPDSGDFLELPKVDNKVAERLQNELSNLQNEDKRLQADYDALLKSSTVVANKLREEVQKLRSQLETERADREEIEIELSDLKQKSATASELPEAADVLNQLKARRKKSKTDLSDIEVLLKILGLDAD
jgi:chromosome segregation ATPase